MPPSATLVEEQISTEVDEDRHEVACDCPVIVSALGAVPKPNSNDIHLIHDYSQPVGRPVNDYAPLGDKLGFQTLDDVVGLLTRGDIVLKWIWNLLTAQYLYIPMIMILLDCHGLSRDTRPQHIW